MKMRLLILICISFLASFIDGRGEEVWLPVKLIEQYRNKNIHFDSLEKYKNYFIDISFGKRNTISMGFRKGDTYDYSYKKVNGNKNLYKIICLKKYFAGGGLSISERERLYETDLYFYKKNSFLYMIFAYPDLKSDTVLYTKYIKDKIKISHFLINPIEQNLP